MTLWHKLGQTTFPSNETETIELYKLVQGRLGWPIVHLQTVFPDAVIENGKGKQLVAEFEYLAKNFRAHKHDPSGCDLIVCWRNDWKDAPLPVWALEDCANDEARLIARVVARRDKTLLSPPRGKSLPAGAPKGAWVEIKNVSGCFYYYMRWREGKRKKSKYLGPAR